MPVATARTNELAGFLPATSIDPVQNGTAYYLSPDGPAAQKPYVLLHKALERSNGKEVRKGGLRDDPPGRPERDARTPVGQGRRDRARQVAVPGLLHRSRQT